MTNTPMINVKDFVSQRHIAIIGASRTGKKFGNYAMKELKQRDYMITPVHPSAEFIDGVKAYANLKSIPEPVDGVLIVVPPDQTEKVVREVAEAGIKRVWMQQGSESEDAIRFCNEKDIPVVSGECIMMFAHDTAVLHRMHHWIWRLLGKLPQ
jgi:predicted CoA-binding protein